MPLISPAWRPPSRKKAGLSVSLPVFLFVMVICQISRPSNDWPTEVQVDEIRLLRRPHLEQRGRLLVGVVVLEIDLPGVQGLELGVVNLREHRHAIADAGHAMERCGLGCRPSPALPLHAFLGRQQHPECSDNK